MWKRPIEGYLTHAPHLIGLVLLVDARRDPTPEDHQLVEWLATRAVPAMIAVTKTDKLTRDQANRKVTEVENAFGAPTIPFSAVSGVGKNELAGAIFELVSEHDNK